MASKFSIPYRKLRKTTQVGVSSFTSLKGKTKNLTIMAPQRADVGESDDPEYHYCIDNSEEEYLDDDSINVNASQSEACDTDYNESG